MNTDDAHLKLVPAEWGPLAVMGGVILCVIALVAWSYYDSVHRPIGPGCKTHEATTYMQFGNVLVPVHSTEHDYDCPNHSK